MDRKTKAQAAWALLLALLGLLAFGVTTPSTPGSPSPSPSPTPGGTGTGSGSGSGTGNGTGTEEPAGDETGDSTGDGWLPPDEDETGEGDGSPSPAPDDSPTTGPSGTEDGNTYDNDDDLPTQPTDEYPDADDDGEDATVQDPEPGPVTDPADPIEDITDGEDGSSSGDGGTAPVDPEPGPITDPTEPIENITGGEDGSSSDGGTTPPEDGEGTTDGPGVEDWGIIGDPDDLPESTGSGGLPAALDDLPDDLASDFQTAASILALPASSLYQKAKDPVTSMSHDVVSYAKENPGKAVVIVGVSALTGGAVIYATTGWTVAGSSVASSLAVAGVPRMSPQAAQSRIEELTGGGENSGESSSGSSAPVWADPDEWTDAPTDTTPEERPNEDTGPSLDDDNDVPADAGHESNDDTDTVWNTTPAERGEDDDEGGVPEDAGAPSNDDTDTVWDPTPAEREDDEEDDSDSISGVPRGRRRAMERMAGGVP